MDTYVKWTDEEWAALAKRAAALKAAKPDMSWTQIVPVCQDDIAPERRRFSINKLSGLKPMFDILALDEQGNPKPPPPPEPEPEPEPELPPAPVTLATSLKDVPIDLLITEIFARGTTLKQDMELLSKMEASIKATQAEQAAKLELCLKRVDEVESTALQCLEHMDKINRHLNMLDEAYERLTSLDSKVLKALSSLDPKAETVLRQCAEQELVELATRPVKTPPKMAPVRVLIVGVIEKELPRIKDRLPRQLNVELIHGPNSENITLPANINYALVSGHNDCTRRWQTIRAHYGDKAHRMANGSIGTFVHAIEELCALRG